MTPMDPTELNDMSERSNEVRSFILALHGAEAGGDDVPVTLNETPSHVQGVIAEHGSVNHHAINTATIASDNTNNTNTDGTMTNKMTYKLVDQRKNEPGTNKHEQQEQARDTPLAKNRVSSDSLDIHASTELNFVPLDGHGSFRSSDENHISMSSTKFTEITKASYSPTSLRSTDSVPHLRKLQNSTDALALDEGSNGGSLRAPALSPPDLADEGGSLKPDFVETAPEKDEDRAELESELYNLSFGDLDKSIPWTEDMEKDNDSERPGLRRRKKPQPPLRDDELNSIRKLIVEKEGSIDGLSEGLDEELLKDKSSRGQALLKLKGRELRPTGQLSEDTFSFLISSRIGSVPWLTGFSVLILKASIFVLITSNMMSGNPPGNPLGIPASVSTPVLIAQVIALIIAVASQDDIRTSLTYFYEGYDHRWMGQAFPGASYPKWFVSVGLQFFQGCLGLVTTFLLILTSDDVVNLMLDFTAVEFVVLLDNGAFEIARQGFFGASNRDETGIIEHTEYPISRKRTPGLQICTLVVTFVAVLAGWATIYTRQIRGDYSPQSIYVQFDDSVRSELSAYTGYYTLSIKPWSFDINRLLYKADNGEGFFGYCMEERAWTFSLEGTHPCNKIVAQSESTPSFDITSIGSSDWSVTADMDTGRVFLMESFYLDTGCTRDYHCGGPTHGVCVDNRCVCADDFFGVRCDYQHSKVCSRIRVDEETPIFRATRDYSTEYDLLRKDDGSIIQAYHHPIYYKQTRSGFDVILYTGIRWALVNSRTGFPELKDHTEEGLVAYLSEHSFHTTKLAKLEFFTEHVLFDSPDDGDSPSDTAWFGVRGDSPEDWKKSGAVTTRILCAVCDEDDNPCQNGNTCSADGACDCTNGAQGSLCQITPLGNGHCDTYFNDPVYNYDGGDCCQATCVNKDQNTCGVVTSGTIEGVEIGFPYCVDPAVVVSDCSSDNCWTPTSSDLEFLSAENPALTYLSANGRIMAMAEPGLDALRVFDQTDSRWVQRGPTLEGTRGSQFGKTLALSTLPGAVVGRRFGKVPILMAIGLHGAGVAGIRVVRWEPNDIDWRAVGDTIDICDVGGSFDMNECDLKALDIVRYGDRVTLTVVRSDNVALVYRHTLSETGANPWVLQYYAIGSEQGDLGAEPKPYDVFHSTSVSPTSGGVYENGNAAVFGIGLSVEFVRLSDDLEFVNEENTVEGAQNMHLFNPPETLPMTFDNPQFATEFFHARHFLGWQRRDFEDKEVGAVKIAPDGLSFLLHMYGNLGLDTIARVEIKETDTTVTYMKNFTSPVLTDSQIDAGIVPVRYSFDATSYAIREPQPNGTDLVHVLKYDADVFSFLQVGSSFEDKGLDMSISYDAAVYVESSVSGSSSGYGIVPRCTTDKAHYRLAITLDETPESFEWIVETYQTLGPLTFARKQIRQCENCYFDNDRFGRGIVAEDICVLDTDVACGRLRFQTTEGFRPGAGIVMYRDGEEVFQHEGDETSEIIYTLGTAEGCDSGYVQCGDDESHILLELRFDTFPEQTSWVVQDSSGNTLGSGTNYTFDSDASQTRLFQMCGPKDDDYTLVVEDDNGDFANGLCCEWGDGGYDLYVDFEKVYTREGERSFRFDKVIFNSDGVVEEPVPVTFEFQLDGYSEETLWHVELPDYTVVYVNLQYEGMPNALVSKTLYLSPNQDYNLVIHDLYEDGFCCAAGNGYYNIYYGNTTDRNMILVSGTGEFTGRWFEVSFTLSEDSIVGAPETSAPVAPTLVPTLAPVAVADCGDEESHILFELRFDGAPEETSWTIQDSGGNSLGSGAGYDASFANQARIFQTCGPKGGDYTLVVEDNDGLAGNGLCCSMGDGGYDLYVNSEKVYTRGGERVFRFDKIVFNENGVVEEPVPATIELQLDAYSHETAWQVELPDYTLLYYHTFYQGMPDALVSETIYLSPNQNYTLAIRDGYGDGFCCSLGNGYYNVYYGNSTDPNMVLASGTGEFVGEWLEVPFTLSVGSITDVAGTNSTAAPTAAPVPSSPVAAVVNTTTAPAMVLTPDQPVAVATPSPFVATDNSTEPAEIQSNSTTTQDSNATTGATFEQQFIDQP